MSRSAPQQVTRSAPFQLLARVGLVTYGVVHLLVAWLAVQIAVGDLDGGGVGKTDKTGALQSIAGAGGAWLLWVIAVGLGASALWQLFEGLSGDWSHGRERWLRVMNLGEALLFGYLSFSAGKLAGGGAASSTDKAQQGLIGSLLSESWGKPVVIAIGVAVIVAALFIAHHGWSRRFTEEHDTGRASRATRRTVLRLGQVGYASLGVVYGGAGVLVVVSAVQSQPAKATGLDVALKTLAAQPYGTWLLLLVAAGLVVFGVFTFFDARFRRA
jgi:hypothetical protein